tara:strand:- start:19084 stop:19587 length:504 start_codon:yes stop_codon:yes gene_type:complete
VLVGAVAVPAVCVDLVLVTSVVLGAPQCRPGYGYGQRESGWRTDVKTSYGRAVLRWFGGVDAGSEFVVIVVSRVRVLVLVLIIVLVPSSSITSCSADTTSASARACRTWCGWVSAGAVARACKPDIESEQRVGESAAARKGRRLDGTGWMTRTVLDAAAGGGGGSVG